MTEVSAVGGRGCTLRAADQLVCWLLISQLDKFTQGLLTFARATTSKRPYPRGDQTASVSLKPRKKIVHNSFLETFL